MKTLDEIISKNQLQQILSLSLKNALLNSAYEIQLATIDDHSNVVQAIDLLIEDAFDSKGDDYKPSLLLETEPHSICIACRTKEKIIGGITFSFNPAQRALTIHSLIVDSKWYNQKIGSMLMLAAHDVALELNAQSIALLASNVSHDFYLSFNFTHQGSNMFEVKLPFTKEIVNKKITAFMGLHHHNESYGLFFSKSEPQEIHDQRKNQDRPQNFERVW